MSLDATPVMLRSVGLYCNTKLPEVTFNPELSAIGIPLFGCSCGKLIVATPIVIPAVVVVNNSLVAVANDCWNVTSTLAPVVVSLVATTTELLSPLALPTCVMAFKAL